MSKFKYGDKVLYEGTEFVWIGPDPTSTDDAIIIINDEDLLTALSSKLTSAPTKPLEPGDKVIVRGVGGQRPEDEAVYVGKDPNNIGCVVVILMISGKIISIHKDYVKLKS
jgi:hypothetical protein